MATKFKVGKMYAKRDRPNEKIFRFLLEVPDAAEDQRTVFVRTDTGVLTVRSSEGKFLANRDCDYDIITQPEEITIYGAVMADRNGSILCFTRSAKELADDAVNYNLRNEGRLIKEFQHTETYED